MVLAYFAPLRKRKVTEPEFVATEFVTLQSHSRGCMSWPKAGHALFRKVPDWTVRKKNPE